MVSTSKTFIKAPTPGVDLSIQKSLKALRNDNSKFSRNNNNEGLLPPPPSLRTFNNFIPPPTGPPPPPLLFNLLQQPQYFPPPPPPLLSPPLSSLLLPRSRQKSLATQPQPVTLLGEMTMTKAKPKEEQILQDIDTAVYEIS